MLSMFAKSILHIRKSDLQNIIPRHFASTSNIPLSDTTVTIRVADHIIVRVFPAYNKRISNIVMVIQYQVLVQHAINYIGSPYNKEVTHKCIERYYRFNKRTPPTLNSNAMLQVRINTLGCHICMEAALNTVEAKTQYNNTCSPVCCKTRYRLCYGCRGKTIVCTWCKRTIPCPQISIMGLIKASNLFEVKEKEVVYEQTPSNHHVTPSPVVNHHTNTIATTAATAATAATTLDVATNSYQPDDPRLHASAVRLETRSSSRSHAELPSAGVPSPPTPVNPSYGTGRVGSSANHTVTTAENSTSTNAPTRQHHQSDRVTGV